MTKALPKQSGHIKSEAHMLNSAAEPKDSQFRRRCHLSPPNRNPFLKESIPKIIMRTNISSAMKKKPTICSVSPSDFAMMNFSRAYDTGVPTIVEGASPCYAYLSRADLGYFGNYSELLRKTVCWDSHSKCKPND